MKFNLVLCFTLIYCSINTCTCPESELQQPCTDEEISTTREDNIEIRVVTFYMAKQYNEALLCLDKALAKYTSNAKFYTFRGKIHFEMKNIDLAISDWKQAVVLSVEQENYANESWGYLISHIIDTGKDTDVTEVVDVSLDDVIKLAEELCSRGKFLEAGRSFSDVIIKSPNKRNVFNARGKCYNKMGDIGNANRDFRHAAKLPA